MLLMGEVVQGGFQQLLDASHANERAADFEPELDLLVLASGFMRAMVSWQTSNRLKLSCDGGLCSVSMRIFLMTEEARIASALMF